MKPFPPCETNHYYKSDEVLSSMTIEMMTRAKRNLPIGHTVVCDIYSHLALASRELVPQSSPIVSQCGVGVTSLVTLQPKIKYLNQSGSLNRNLLLTPTPNRRQMISKYNHLHLSVIRLFDAIFCWR